MTMSWTPSASVDALRQRAQFLARIRQFFAVRDVLEVETPLLSSGTITDVHLEAFETVFHSPVKPDSQTLYLQTSPEFAMKRLLCAGSGSIFQISKAFRNEEAGRHHNPEFTLLEWYRVGFDDRQLMDELDALVQHLLACERADRISYQQVFKQHLQCDPLTADVATLRALASTKGFTDIAANETNRDTLLQLLFSQCIEPLIGQQRPCMVYHFPASQAALAKLEQSDRRVARRFELYYQGLELANGFHELSDHQEQRDRFKQDNQLRQVMGRHAKPIDRHFLAALQAGMPDCAGVAVGVDRLLMLALGKSDIAEVMSFSVDNA